MTGRPVACSQAGWRSGDQLYFVADTRRLSEAVLWRARIGWREGLRDLADWIGTELTLSNTEETVRRRRVRA
jgi:CDP-paratose 2-epimerase